MFNFKFLKFGIVGILISVSVGFASALLVADELSTELSLGNRDYYNDMFIASNGYIFVVYDNDIGADNKVIVKQYNGSDWSIIGSGINAGDLNSYSSIAIVADSSNRPIVAYYDDVDNLSVQRYNGSSWDVLGTGLRSSSSSQIDITVDSGDNIYTAVRILPGIYVNMYDGSSWTGWNNISNANSSRQADLPSIVVENDGDIWVTYAKDDNGGTLRRAYASFYDGSSRTSNIGGAISVGRCYDSGGPKIILQNNGKPMVVCEDRSLYDLVAFEYSGSNWETIPAVFTGDITAHAIAADSNGDIYVGYAPYSSSNRAVLTKYDDGTGWDILSEGFASGFVSTLFLEFDDSDVPIFSYYDAFNSISVIQLITAKLQSYFIGFSNLGRNTVYAVLETYFNAGRENVIFSKNDSFQFLINYEKEDGGTFIRTPLGVDYDISSLDVGATGTILLNGYVFKTLDGVFVVNP